MLDAIKDTNVFQGGPTDERYQKKFRELKKKKKRHTLEAALAMRV
jgi:hypothetical protein